MRKLHLGQPIVHGNDPLARIEQKLDWCIKALQRVETASHDIDAFQVADGFTVTDLTEDRTMSANVGTLADLAAAQAAINKTRDVLGTLISDLKKRGQTRTG